MSLGSTSNFSCRHPSAANAAALASSICAGDHTCTFAFAPKSARLVRATGSSPSAMMLLMKVSPGRLSLSTTSASRSSNDLTDILSFLFDSSKAFGRIISMISVKLAASASAANRAASASAAIRDSSSALAAVSAICARDHTCTFALAPKSSRLVRATGSSPSTTALLMNTSAGRLNLSTTSASRSSNVFTDTLSFLFDSTSPFGMTISMISVKLAASSSAAIRAASATASSCCSCL